MEVKLFDLLDAFVLDRSTAFPCAGTVTVAIAGTLDWAFWRINLQSLVIERSAEPLEADATLVTTLAEANRWASGLGLSSETSVRISGNRELARLFAKLLPGGASALALRARPRGQV